MRTKLFLPLLLLTLSTLDSVDTVADNQLNQIKDGLKFANDLTTAMKPLAFTGFLGTAATNAISFISTTITFVSLIFSFLGNNESQELLAIKQLYTEMNRRFDVIDNELLDIKRQLNWTRVSNQFSKTERDITTVTRLFKNIYEGPLAIRNSEKTYFINSFESTCTNCAFDLYHGIIGVNKGLSDDILQTAMTSLQYNRPQMQTFMLGILKLLVLGLNNELAYRKLKFGEADYLYTKQQWESRLNNVTEKMKNINAVIKSNYKHQSENDIASISRNFPRRDRLSNQIFSKKLYDFLDHKFDWRDWLVIVYKPVSANKYNFNHICDGYVKYRTYDRNMIVASVDQFRPPINTTYLKTIINSAITSYTSSCSTYYHYLYGKQTTCLHDRAAAETIYSNFPVETRNCKIYASVGVIDSGYEPCYHGRLERLVHQEISSGVNSYSIYFFR